MAAKNLSGNQQKARQGSWGPSDHLDPQKNWAIVTSYQGPQ